MQIQKYYNKDHGPFPQQLLTRTPVAINTNTVPYTRTLPSYYLDGLISNLMCINTMISNVN